MIRPTACLRDAARAPRSSRVSYAPQQEAAEKLEAARKQGTGWVKVDKDLVARVQSARQKVDAALQKAV